MTKIYDPINVRNREIFSDKKMIHLTKSSYLSQHFFHTLLNTTGSLRNDKIEYEYRYIFSSKNLLS